MLFCGQSKFNVMKHTIKVALSAVILLLSSGAVSAQKINTITEKEINAMVDSLLYSPENGFAGNPKITGAAIGIYLKGKTYLYSYGLADKELQVKVDTNTLFEIGSNTKVFTA